MSSRSPVMKIPSFVSQVLRRHRHLGFALFLAAALLAAPGVRGQVAEVTAPREKPVVRATVTSVESSLGGNGWHYLAAAVHLQNLTKGTLVLGVDPGKVSVTDDRR